MTTRPSMELLISVMFRQTLLRERLVGRKSQKLLKISDSLHINREDTKCDGDHRRNESVSRKQQINVEQAE